MQFRTAFPVALVLGAALGGAAAVAGADPAARDGEPRGLIREAAAATAVRWDIPVARNDAVDRFVTLFTGRRSALMAEYLKRSGRYEGMIRGKLRGAGMPEDLVYLTMIESGFNTNARSSANAVGLWQFMSGTARGYGLRVDGYVDERRDPEKSTDAAVRYLRDLHTQLGSWYLAAAAYNGGDGRVSRALRAETGSARGTGDADFWRIRHRLPRETSDYVPLMVAAAVVGKEPEKYGLGQVARWMPLEADTVSVPAGTELATVAQAAGVSEREVARLNPHLVRKVTPPGKTAFPVRIPDGRGSSFADAFPALHAEALARAAVVRAHEQAVSRERAAERRAEARRAAARRHRASSTAAAHRRSSTTASSARRRSSSASARTASHRSKASAHTARRPVRHPAARKTRRHN